MTAYLFDKKPIRMSIPLTEGDFKRLKLLARRLGRTQTELARTFILDAVNERLA